MILLISASQVARMTGVSHQRLLSLFAVLEFELWSYIHLEPLHQPVFVKGFFPDRIC
jgi:hypothetical protein